MKHLTILAGVLAYTALIGSTAWSVNNPPAEAEKYEAEENRKQDMWERQRQRNKQRHDDCDELARKAANSDVSFSDTQWWLTFCDGGV